MRKKVLQLIPYTIIALVVLFIGREIYNLKSFSSHYFNVLGLSKSMSTQEITQIIKESKNSIIKDESNIIIKCYGFDIVVEKHTEKNYLFKRIEIYDDIYKFTWSNICVGANKEKIEWEYRNSVPIKDLAQNEVGYIVDNLWIKFQFAEDETVEKIDLFYGP